MRRDKQKGNDRQHSRGGTLIGMFIGLVLGVCIAAGVVWYTNRSHSPFMQNKPAPNGKPETPQTGKPATPGQPLALPGKPGDPVPEKRFQFYDILPGKADAVPDSKSDDAKKDEAKDRKKDDKKEETKKDESRKEEGKKEEKKDEKKEDKKEDKEHKVSVFLQAGSFATAQDADNQKAKLALMGVEATVLQVMVQDKTYYRVRLGPYTKAEEANKVRSELAKSGVEATPMKKEP